MSQFDYKISFLRRVFGTAQLGANANLAVSCPVCKDRTKKKLSIRLDDDRVHCWVCGLSGRLLTLLSKHRPEFVSEYIKQFATQQSAVDLLDYEDKTVLELPIGFRLLAPLYYDPSLEVRWALAYLRQRHISYRDLWYYKFGIANQCHRRVIMPSFDCNGQLNFYTARALDDETSLKYMNSKVEKKAIVFNEINIDWTKELTLVEGPFDLTRCDENATCLLGSSLVEDSYLFLKIYQNRTPIVLALDNDMVDKTWQRIARMLASYDIPVRILDLGSYKDVGEMTKEQFLVAKQAARPWDRMDALSMKIKGMRV
jgi:DNA primase